ncbi:hypothetical protein CVS40_3464 [Lucilia cuprina]|nr:hypothetical protein CVS40_3464 [Lucilia cuprina]
MNSSEFAAFILPAPMIAFRDGFHWPYAEIFGKYSLPTHHCARNKSHYLNMLQDHTVELMY